jgi:ribonuclease BN (tRNA processing enzyme)
VPVDGWPGTDHPPRPRLLAPPGARDAFRRLCAASGMREEHIEKAFTLDEYDPGRPLRVGALEIAFQPVPHYLPTQAVEVAADGRRLTYSADSSPSEELCAFARDTDLLLIEATLPRAEREGPRGHLTPAEAGEHGRRAGARRLVLTHISDELDAEWARREAERAFGGPVEIAHEGAVYAL